MDFEPLKQMIAESESAHRDAIDRMASMFETEREARDRLLVVSVEAERENNARLSDAVAARAQAISDRSNDPTMRGIYASVSMMFGGLSADIRSGKRAPGSVRIDE